MEEKVRDIVELRRTAKEVKKYRMLMRSIALLVVLLIIIVAIAYAVSYFYDRYGAFTIRVNKYDMVRQGLTLSETPDYTVANSRLQADVVNDMTNISGMDLPSNIDMVNGPHNGESYIAYTFYLINSGDDTVSYEGTLNIENITKNVDEAVRVAVWINGEKKVYGKTKSDGSGKEKDCDETFLSSNMVMKTSHDAMGSKQKDKFTVVIWLEGNDPDCTNDIIGGTLKLGMDFKLIETT